MSCRRRIFKSARIEIVTDINVVICELAHAALIFRIFAFHSVSIVAGWWRIFLDRVPNLVRDYPGNRGGRGARDPQISQR